MFLFERFFVGCCGRKGSFRLVFFSFFFFSKEKFSVLLLLSVRPISHSLIIYYPTVIHIHHTINHQHQTTYAIFHFFLLIGSLLLFSTYLFLRTFKLNNFFFFEIPQKVSLFSTLYSYIFIRYPQPRFFSFPSNFVLLLLYLFFFVLLFISYYSCYESRTKMLK